MKKIILFTILPICMLLTAGFPSDAKSGGSAQEPVRTSYVLRDSHDYLSIPIHASPARVQPVAAINNLPELVMPVSDIKFENLDISTEFAVTRPERAISTTFEAYFITGTSDPKLGVYMDGEEIERLGTKGVFGKLVELEPGENTFTFTQGYKNITVTITRKPKAPPPIKEIIKDSMFPTVQGGVRVGETIPLTCVAPSGAEVSATFGGKSVSLTQSKKALPGIPAVFTGSMTVVGVYDGDIVRNAGPVIYSMRFDGAVSEYRSSGNMYVAGENAGLAVEVTSFAAFIYPDLSNTYQISEKLRTGARDYMTDQNNEYIKLASGGWVTTGAVKIIEGAVDIGNTVKGAEQKLLDDRERYIFECTDTPAYYSRVEDGVFKLTIYNSEGSPELKIQDSRIFSSAAFEKTGTSLTWSFQIKNPMLFWSYSVSYDEYNLILQIKYKPSSPPESKTPLEGVRILLDPGHGGGDPGALGVAGMLGPFEKTVNHAHALAIADRLSSLGAEVAITRDGDSAVSLDKRMEITEDWDADIFLSIHHNSVSEDKDANKISGMEIYYHNNLSKNLADSMMDALSMGINRNNRGVYQSIYRVTLMPCAPSILIELGFLSNPLEYEKAVSTDEILYAANAVANGIINCLQKR